MAALANPLDALRDLQIQMQAMQQQIADQNNTIAQQQDQILAIPVAPPVQVQAPAHIKPDQPSPFCGKKSESLEAWIFQMQQYCILAPVPEADQIPFMATFFKDQVALWWRSYHQSIDWQNAAPDWNSFLTAI